MFNIFNKDEEKARERQLRTFRHIVPGLDFAYEPPTIFDKISEFIQSYKDYKEAKRRFEENSQKENE